MKRAAYPKYKESGVPWLGEVPEHWDVRRSDGILISDRNQLNPEAFKDEAVFHYSIPAVQEYGTGLVEEGESIASAKQRITEKCLLVSKLNPRKATICVAEPQQLKTLCSTEFVVLKSRQCDLDFLFYFSQTEIFRQGLDSKVQSVTRSHQRATPEDIYKFWSAWPPETEQTAIADFLDSETGRIDTLVEKKRVLIGLLKEKRTALISRTVTRGLPAAVAREFGLEPHNRLTDSGVEWLGEVPEGWAMPPLYSRYSIELGKMLDQSRITGQCLVPYLRNVDVQWDSINFEDLPEMDIPEVERQRYTVREGDLLVCEGGEVGRAAIVGQQSGMTGYQKALHRMRAIKPKDVPRYMYYTLFWAAKTGVFNAGGISTIAHLTGEQLRKYRFPTPGLSEQTAIAAYLDRETVKLDMLVEKVEAAIARLQEYRTALITAAVTGKIDVRTDRPTDIKEAC